MSRANPALVVFGNRPHGTFPVSEHSEARAWKEVLDGLEDAMTELEAGQVRVARERLVDLHGIVMTMLNQVRRGVHTNPRVREPLISEHVQAIAYVHKKDGECYVHGFGDAKLNDRELDRGVLRLGDLKSKTGVRLSGHADGTLSLAGARGQSLSDLFGD
jgi:hypothetical protein